MGILEIEPDRSGARLQFGCHFGANVAQLLVGQTEGTDGKFDFVMGFGVLNSLGV